jgi:CubicO group peptidase (beta-lactamase class C family)
MTKKVSRKLSGLFLAVLLFMSCQSGPDDYTYQVPEQIGDGWETASLSDVGMDPQCLADMINKLNNYGEHRVHSILVVRQGKLVFEEYFSGLSHPTIGSQPMDFDRHTLHVLSSATKSYTSALLGIAIREGFIEDENQKVFDFFPELAHLETGNKKNLTLKHMITMSSGLQWDQTTYYLLDERNDIAQMQHADNPWEMYLSRPLVTVPGETFLYSEGSINLIGEVIRRASGIRLDRFAEQYLFNPLGIQQHWWYLVNEDIGFIWASGDLRQRPRDMARFGLLYLREGQWNGQQLIPRQWVERSAQKYFTFTPPFWSLDWGLVGYGYAWWIKSSEYGRGAYCAVGWGDQCIMVIPEHDLVTVFTAGAYDRDPILSSHDLMVRYILPSLQ